MGPPKPARPWGRILIVSSLALFFVLLLVGTLWVRKGMLARTMLKSMEMEDAAMMASLANSWFPPTGIVDKSRRTPLHVAALMQDNELVATLLDRGGDPNARDQYGCTPLHYARKVAVARALLDGGARIEESNAAGQSALNHAVSSFEEDKPPRAGGATVSRALHLRMPSGPVRPWGDAELVAFLIARGANINEPDYRMRTPLRVARLVRVWLRASASADPSAGITPELLGDWDRIIETLVKHGAVE